MSDKESKTEQTNGLTQPARSPDVSPQVAAQGKLKERLESIDRYRNKMAALPDQGVAQLGQMNADLLEMQTLIANFIINKAFLNGNFRWDFVEPIGVAMALARQTAQLFKLENELSSK